VLGLNKLFLLKALQQKFKNFCHKYLKLILSPSFLVRTEVPFNINGRSINATADIA